MDKVLGECYALVTGDYWTTWAHLRLILGVRIVGSDSVLACLPTELLKHVARFAWRPRIVPRFQPLSDDLLQRLALEIGDTLEEVRKSVRLEGDGRTLFVPGTIRERQSFQVDSLSNNPIKLQMPAMAGMHYFELDFFAWYGTCVRIHNMMFHILCRLEDWDLVYLHEYDQSGANANLTRSLHVDDWLKNARWEHNRRTNTLGLLFSFNAAGATVLTRFNGHLGPRVRLGAGCLDGIEITICDVDDSAPWDTESDPLIYRIRSPAVPWQMADPVARVFEDDEATICGACSGCDRCMGGPYNFELPNNVDS
jgi:hypothetical protein